MKKILLLIIAFISYSQLAEAQHDAQLSQYFMAKNYYNPAAIGLTDDLNLFGLHRQQWIGIKGAPKSFLVTADRKLKIGKNFHGIGIVAFTESIGLFQNTNIGGQFAYRQKLFGGELNIGLQLGATMMSFDGTKANIEIKKVETEAHEIVDDGIPISNVNGMTIDANLGLFYTYKDLYVGMASSHIAEPDLKFDNVVSTYLRRGYNLTSGYNIKLKNPLYELHPSVFLKTDMQTFQADITARLLYNKMFSGGLSYRVNESVIVMLGATLGGVEVGYAYDLPTTPILKHSTGSHEIMVRYKLKLNKTKTGQYKHKSVRIL